VNEDTVSFEGVTVNAIEHQIPKDSIVGLAKSPKQNSVRKRYKDRLIVM
jgi:hypothetical protein